jgi:hypothetical protein
MCKQQRLASTFVNLAVQRLVLNKRVKARCRTRDGRVANVVEIGEQRAPGM